MYFLYSEKKKIVSLCTSRSTNSFIFQFLKKKFSNWALLLTRKSTIGIKFLCRFKIGDWNARSARNGTAITTTFRHSLSQIIHHSRRIKTCGQCSTCYLAPNMPLNNKSKILYIPGNNDGRLVHETMAAAGLKESTNFETKGTRLQCGQWLVSG